MDYKSRFKVVLKEYCQQDHWEFEDAIELSLNIIPTGVRYGYCPFSFSVDARIKDYPSFCFEQKNINEYKRRYTLLERAILGKTISSFKPDKSTKILIKPFEFCEWAKTKGFKFPKNMEQLIRKYQVNSIDLVQMYKELQEENNKLQEENHKLKNELKFNVEQREFKSYQRLFILVTALHFSSKEINGNNINTKLLNKLEDSTKDGINEKGIKTKLSELWGISAEELDLKVPNHENIRNKLMKCKDLFKDKLTINK